MKEQLTKLLAGIKEFWNKLEPGRRKFIKFLGFGGLTAAILIAAWLNFQSSQYELLYPTPMNGADLAAVSAVLNEMEGITPKFNAQGQILLPTAQVARAQMALAELDLPKNAMTYDTFLNAGLTATDADKQKMLILDYESQVAYTLSHGIDGVSNAMVKLNLPNESTHVWDQSAVANTASAGITITMKPGYTLSPERVSAVKRLVSKGLPNMLPESVVVVDGSTGIEMTGTDETTGGASTKRMKLEMEYAAMLEDKAKRLLSPSFPDGVNVVAAVSLNLDKTMIESLEQSQPGTLSHLDEQYSINGQVPAGDIVGEENNTDTPPGNIPSYLQGDGAGGGGVTDFQRSLDYQLGYIKTQIEQGEPVLKDSSLAVTINTDMLSDSRKAELIDQLAKATMISPASITVGQMNPPAITPPSGTPMDGQKAWWELIPWYFWIIPPLVLFLFILIFVLSRKRRKAKNVAAAQESEELINSLQAEIEERKKQITSAAKAEMNVGDGAIMQEVRSFAKVNPEITANLIRSWLKEDQ